MGRAGVLQGVRQMRFEGLLERHERGELSQEEAAEMLGVSERTFRAGASGRVMGGRRACAIAGSANRRAAAEEILRMLGLYSGPDEVRGSDPSSLQRARSSWTPGFFGSSLRPVRHHVSPPHASEPRSDAVR